MCEIVIPGVGWTQAEAIFGHLQLPETWKKDFENFGCFGYKHHDQWLSVTMPGVDVVIRVKVLTREIRKIIRLIRVLIKQ